MQIAILRLRGQPSEGLQATLEWRPEGQFQIQGTVLGALPPAVNLTDLYADWRRQYCALGEATRLEFEADPSQRFSHRRRNQALKRDCNEAAQQLEESFQNWLQRSSDFQRIGRQLAELYGANHEVQLQIRTDDPELQQLPWHLWKEICDRNIPITLSALEHDQGQLEGLRFPVRILAILGSDRNLDLSPDLESLQSLPGVELTVQTQPQRQDVTQALKDDKGWDIIFFAGHSRTQDQQGILSINATDSLTSKELHHHLSFAVSQGLKICIFNSCDGQGLARHLNTLQLPYIIYMREPVPDAVAHHFFQSFIRYFSDSNHSIHDAFSAAQRDLEAIQDRYPYATWLPTLLQQPQTDSLHWPQPQADHQPFGKHKLKFLVLFALIAFFALIATALLTFYGHRKQPSTLTQGDSISQGEEVLGTLTPPKVDATHALEASNHDEAINKLEESLQDDAKDPETLIYLNNALIDKHQIPHYTIAVVVPFLRNPVHKKMTSNALAYRLLQGIAQAQTEANREQIKDKFQQITPYLDISKLQPNPLTPNIGLKIVIADDHNTIDEARERATALVENQEVLGVVGHYASDMSKPSLDIYKPKKLPIISPGSTAKGLPERGKGYFFRTVPSTVVEAASMAKHLLAENKFKAMVYYNPQSPFTHSLWKEFKDIYEQAGGQVVLEVKPGNAATDIASEKFDPNRAISALEAYAPNETALLLVPDGEVSPAMENATKLLTTNAGKYDVVGSWGMDNPKTLAVLRQEHLPSPILSVPWHAASSQNPQFPKQAQQLWNQVPNGQTALAYDATRTLIEALRQQLISGQEPSREGTREVLSSRQFQAKGATGKISFEGGERKTPPQVLIKAVKCGTDFQFLPLGQLCPISTTPAEG